MLTDEMRKLVEDNHNLIYYYCNTNGLSVDEWYGVLAIALCKAAKMFDESKAKFTTLAMKCMKNAVLHETRLKNADMRKANLYTVSLETPLNDTQTIADVLCGVDEVAEDVATIANLSQKISTLTERERIYIKLSIIGYKQCEIGKIFGLSKAMISNIKNELRGKLA